MKLYTRSGDDGSTGLFGGERVAKDHPRVEAYGCVDETNAIIGLCMSACRDESTFERNLRELLQHIQSRLFDIGADLATPAGNRHEAKINRITSEHVVELEHAIDTHDAVNPPMKSFILPGGTELASRLHVARTTCRRAERRVVEFAHQEPVTEHVPVYLNRLSDLLFALARRANHEAGVDDVPWTEQTSKRRNDKTSK